LLIGIASHFYMPLVMSAALVFVVTLGMHLASTKLGFSLKLLTPNFNRLNPIKKLSQLPGQTFPALLQAFFVLALAGFTIYHVVADNLQAMMMLPMAGVQSGAASVFDSIHQLLWRVGGILLILGAIDAFRKFRKHDTEMKMSKQEIRDESKEMMGNPHLKMRIRRMQRDYARRKMLQDVPTATAVVVNPTHYAVAIRYEIDSKGGPVVVAKGKNFLALRIRTIAMQNQVPIIENPPLARAMYAAVKVGQEIPPDFYRAVAEILAYIYRLMGNKLQRPK
jgi:flagellar biosynthetic protein FlhB